MALVPMIMAIAQMTGHRLGRSEQLQSVGRRQMNLPEPTIRNPVTMSRLRSVPGETLKTCARIIVARSTVLGCRVSRGNGRISVAEDNRTYPF